MTTDNRELSGRTKRKNETEGLTRVVRKSSPYHFTLPLASPSLWLNPPSGRVGSEALRASGEGGCAER